jgi:hypothetical protein
MTKCIQCGLSRDRVTEQPLCPYCGEVVGCYHCATKHSGCNHCQHCGKRVVWYGNGWMKLEVAQADTMYGCDPAAQLPAMHGLLANIVHQLHIRRAVDQSNGHDVSKVSIGWNCPADNIRICDDTGCYDFRIGLKGKPYMVCEGAPSRAVESIACAVVL